MNDERERPAFGDLDGEPIEAVVVKFAGSGVLDRKPEEGERILLMVEGHVSLTTIKRQDGRLIRVHTLKAAKIAEPVDALADEVERFIQEVDDRRGGTPGLPFDEGEEGEGEEEAEA